MNGALYGDDPEEAGITDHNGIMALDTETTGLEWSDSIIGLSLAWRRDGEVKSCYYVIEREASLNQAPLFVMEAYRPITQLLLDIFRANRVVAHWLPFDHRVMFKAIGREGMFPDSVDTIYLARSTAYHASYKLVDLAWEVLGIKPPSDVLDIKEDRGHIKNLPLEQQALYGRWDAETALLLYEALWPVYLDQVTEEMRKHDFAFVRLVQGLVERGVPTNRDWLTSLGEQFKDRMLELKRQAMTIGIKDISKDATVRQYLKDAGVALERYTETGLPSVDIEALHGLTHVPGIGQLIEFRQLQKGLGSWITDLLMMSEWDGSCHPILDPFGTKSFRMSSSKINFQGIPIKDRGRAFGSMAGAFQGAVEGKTQYQGDLKQAEVRMAGILSRENALAEVFNIGGDPYIAMSERTWGTKDKRDDAKRAVLAGIYEIGPDKFALTHHVSLDEATSILRTFRKAFPKIKEASRYWSNFVEQEGWVPSYKGRRIYFGPEDRSWKAFNQRVQSSVSEYMQDFMLEFDFWYPETMNNQVHDATWYVLDDKKHKTSDVEAHLRDIAREVMTPKFRTRTNPEIPFLLDIETMGDET